MIQCMQQVEQYIESMKQGNILKFRTMHVDGENNRTYYNPFGVGVTQRYGLWWITIYEVEDAFHLAIAPKPVKGRKKFLLDKETLRDWLVHIEYLGILV